MIYAYINKDDNREEILQLLSGYSVIEIGDDCLNLSMKNIKKRKSKQYDDNELFTFFYIVNEDIHHMPSLKMGHMAMETEINKKWKLKKLMKEVEEEARYYRIREQLLLQLPKESPLFKSVQSNVFGIDELESILHQQ